MVYLFYNLNKRCDTIMKYTDREHYDGTKDWKNYYWYYYKWHILGILALIIVIVTCTVQCASRVKPDYYVLFFSDTYITDQALEEVTDSLEKSSKDLNGDGKIKVQAVNCSYTEGDNITVRDAAYNQATLQMQSTDACIWVLDKKGVELYYQSDEIDLFTTHSAFDEYDNHSVNAKKLKSFKILYEAAQASGGKDFYVFLRKGSKIGKEVIDKAAK